jgi:disulfide bond formation protein DsbB
VQDRHSFGRGRRTSGREGNDMAASVMGLIRAERVASASVLIAAVAAVTILGAWFFEFGLGLQPCPLCLQQRIPYHVAIPLAGLIAVAAIVRAPRKLLVAGLAIILLTMLASAALALYHAGIEWRWWEGPTDCSGPLGELGEASSLLERMQESRVVRCDEAPWRFLGLSLAGYNVLISLGLARVAIWGLRRRGLAA